MKRLTITLVAVLVTLFMFVGVTSSTPYDPWYDFDDDGDIDIYDIVDIAGRYGTTGTPINKTELLLEMQAKIEELNATVIDLEQRVSVLEGSSSGGVVKIVSESFNGVTDGGDGTLTVTFPGGSFVSAPDIVHCHVVLRAAAAGMLKGALAYPNVSGITSTQFEVEVVEHHGSSTTVNDCDVTVTYLAIDLS